MTTPSKTRQNGTEKYLNFNSLRGGKQCGSPGFDSIVSIHTSESHWESLTVSSTDFEPRPSDDEALVIKCLYCYQYDTL